MINQQLLEIKIYCRFNLVFLLFIDDEPITFRNKNCRFNLVYLLFFDDEPITFRNKNCRFNFNVEKIE